MHVVFRGLVAILSTAGSFGFLCPQQQEIVVDRSAESGLYVLISAVVDRKEKSTAVQLGRESLHDNPGISAGGSL